MNSRCRGGLGVGGAEEGGYRWAGARGQCGGRKVSRPGGCSCGATAWKQGVGMLTGWNLSGESQDGAKACGPRKYRLPLQWTTKVARHQAIAPRPPLLLCRRGFWRKNSRMLALDSAGAFQRNNVIEPRLLNLPIHRKVLKSLTLEIVFFVMKIIFWCSTSFFHSKDSYILWLLPYLFGKILRAIWEAVSQTIVHSKVLE